MKIMCPLGYHYNGFLATHTLGHMMYGYTDLTSVRFDHCVCVVDHL